MQGENPGIPMSFDAAELVGRVGPDLDVALAYGDLDEFTVPVGRFSDERAGIAAAEQCPHLFLDDHGEVQIDWSRSDGG